MDLSKVRAAVLVAPDFQDLEVWYPIYRLREAGCRVGIVGPARGVTYNGKFGVPVTSDAAAKDLSVADFECVVIPGGWAPDHMRRDEAMKRLVKDALSTDRVVGAICHGGWMLASTKAIKGRRVTSFFAIRDDLENAGATWVDQEVCVDGNLITSRVPDDLPAFLRAILGRLSER